MSKAHMKVVCRLCGSLSVCDYCQETFSDRYLHCSQCDFRFVHPKYLLNAQEEKARYLEHNNDVDCPDYQKFMQPVVDVITQYFPSQALGLDFGAGTGPVLKQMLEKKGHSVALYDPFFWPDPGPLSSQYDFITATEVCEHLYEPGDELFRLKSLLKEKGVLVMMTLFFKPDTDFANWYYRRDPTHVGFYSELTLQWITKKFDFKSFEKYGERIAVFQN